MGKTIDLTPQLQEVLTEDATLLFCHTTDEVHISLHHDGRTYVVSWDDLVANEWAEEYDTLELALARTALLIQGSQHEQFFVQTPDEFDRAWADASTRFLEGVPA